MGPYHLFHPHSALSPAALPLPLTALHRAISVLFHFFVSFQRRGVFSLHFSCDCGEQDHLPVLSQMDSRCDICHV